MFGASFLFKTQEKAQTQRISDGGVLGAPKVFMLRFFVCFICAFFGVAQTVFLVNRVFVACQKGAVLTKTAKMMNFILPTETRALLLKTRKTTKKWRVSLRQRHGLEKARFVLPWLFTEQTRFFFTENRALTNRGVQQRTLLGRVLRRVLETAFEKVLRRVLRRYLAVGFNGKKGSEKSS